MIIMDEGAVIQQGEPLAVFNAPTTIRCAEIINDPPMNIFHGAIEDGEIQVQGEIRLKVPAHMTHLPHGPYRFGLRAADLRLGSMIGSQVELSEISGSQTILHLRGDIGAFVLYEDGVYQHAIGDTVQIDLNPDQIFSFSVDGDLITGPAATEVQRR